MKLSVPMSDGHLPVTSGTPATHARPQPLEQHLELLPREAIQSSSALHALVQIPLFTAATAGQINPSKFK